MRFNYKMQNEHNDNDNTKPPQMMHHVVWKRGGPLICLSTQGPSLLEPAQVCMRFIVEVCIGIFSVTVNFNVDRML